MHMYKPEVHGYHFLISILSVLAKNYSHPFCIPYNLIENGICISLYAIKCSPPNDSKLSFGSATYYWKKLQIDHMLLICY